jgi:hypothetical protein
MGLYGCIRNAEGIKRSRVSVVSRGIGEIVCKASMAGRLKAALLGRQMKLRYSLTEVHGGTGTNLQLSPNRKQVPHTVLVYRYPCLLDLGVGKSGR